MPRANWFDDNRQRSYPFLRSSVGIDVPETGLPATMQQLPDDFVVDCGFLPGPHADYDAAVHVVRLHRVSRVGDEFRFEFRSDAPALFDHPLVFTRQIDEEPYAYELVETDYEEPGSGSASASASTSESVAGCFEPLWSGWIVTGRMETLATRMLDGEEIVGAAGFAVVEPAAIVDLSGTVLESLSAYNADRTRVAGAEDCPDPVWPHPVDVTFEVADCLRGDLRIEPGFNCRVTQQDRENRITIGAGVGAGAGEPCEPPPLFETESPPEGSTLLEGGVDCSQTVRRLNGIAGPVLDLLAGRGVAVIQEPENHRVILDVNMLGLNFCFDDESVESISLDASESVSL